MLSKSRGRERNVKALRFEKQKPTNLGIHEAVKSMTSIKRISKMDQNLFE